MDAAVHIAIEGADTSLRQRAGRLPAQSLGGLYIERPLQYLLGGRARYRAPEEKNVS